MADPYLDPVSGVLHNRLGITDPEELARAEADISYLMLARLEMALCPGAYDLAHLCGFHAEIFGPLYPWAGQVRTVEIAKGTWFCQVRNIESFAAEVFGRLAACDHFRGWRRDKFLDALAELYGDMNALHPFREGLLRTDSRRRRIRGG